MKPRFNPYRYIIPMSLSLKVAFVCLLMSVSPPPLRPVLIVLVIIFGGAQFLIWRRMRPRRVVEGEIRNTAAKSIQNNQK